uniref:E2 ubiquitin-conjugating enzyme n=1 Tax=Parascaris univalens TaxID=6257 RepID=A0A915ARA9_PARUN
MTSYPEKSNTIDFATFSLKRIRKEQIHLKRSKPSFIDAINVDEKNQRIWNILLLPPRSPYKNGVFQLSITFPIEYPFKPPQFSFITPIYHPNIDEKGMICLTILQYDNWKTATTIEEAIQSLISLLNDPQPERPMRPEIADQIYKDKAAFLRIAEEHTRKYAERRLAINQSSTNDSISSSSFCV